jgi:hypothetical protein
MATDDVQGQVPTDQTQVVETDVTAEDNGTEPKTFDAEYVSKLRRENATYRKRTQELELAQKQVDLAKLDDVDRLTKENADLKQGYETLLASQRTLEIGQLVEKAAGKVGLDAELVAALVKTDDIDHTDEDAPKQIEKQMRALLQKFPYLAKAPTISATNGGTDTGKPPVMYTRSQLKDPAFFQKHRDDILKAQKEGRITEG